MDSNRVAPPCRLATRSSGRSARRPVLVPVQPGGAGRTPVVNYYALVRPFLAIALLRAGPQELPSSNLLLGLSLAAYMLIGAVSYGLRYPTGVALVASAVEAVVMCLLVAGTLAARQVGARLAQTLTALTGSGAVMTFLALPLHAWLVSSQAAAQVGPAHALVVLGLTGWGLAVTAHILRHALSAALWVGMALSVAYLWVIVQAMDSVFDLLDVR